MIVSETVEIKINKGNTFHYSKFGCNIKNGDILALPIEKLTKGSKFKIVVSCDICKVKYNVCYGDYLNSRKKYKFDTCNKCKHHKSKLTNNERYGCDVPMQNEEILQRFFKTNNKRYGGNSSTCDPQILKKQQITKISNGLQKPSNKPISKFQRYRRNVAKLTNKNKKELFDKWNGYDFYDSEYIKDNFNLHSNNKNYPTIDHKISVLFGYINNIPEIEMSQLNNLVITKRGVNSSKRNKDFELFRESFNKVTDI